MDKDLGVTPPVVPPLPGGTPQSPEKVNGHDRRERRAERLAADWQPSPENLAFAIGLGLDGDAIAESFRDYWHAASGSKARKLDWNATWRIWCRREAERPKPNGKHGPATGIANGFAEALRRADERGDYRDADQPPTRPLLGRQ